MNKAKAGVSVRLWEYPVYLLVTVPLLLIGAILWAGGMILRLLLLFKKSETNA